MTEFTISAKHCGPPRSGNGGWTAGTLAAMLSDAPAPPIEVTLRLPPPLDVAMPVSRSSDSVVAEYDGRTVAEARVVSDRVLTPVPPVAVSEARAAEASYAGLAHHPFPSCYVCGTDRADGLRIFPGLVSRDPARVAATWTPSPSTVGSCDPARASLANTWASLDCVGGWAGDLAERPMVLGRITTRIDSLPEVGSLHVVLGEARGVDGRKVHTASSLYDAATGRLVGLAQHVWFVIDPADFS